MAYIKGDDRRQHILFPDCLEDYVEQDAPVRLFDAFVGKLDRKDNKSAVEKTYKELNRFCQKLKLFSKSHLSIDRSKFKAVNAKNRNFTLSKLDDRISRLDEHIAMYMEKLDAMDAEEGRKLSREDVEHKLDVCQKRKDLYEGYRNRAD